jgi:hypothetical protein
MNQYKARMGQHTSTPTLTFHIVHQKQEAQALLDAAEQKDFYVEECREDETNTLARRGMVYAPNTITAYEYKWFELVVENAKGRLPPRLQHELSTVYLIPLMPSAEGGMPHTRPDNIICYPDIRTFFSVSTLIHELWHLHQRQYAAEWTLVFQSLGWEPWSHLLPTTLEGNRRINPDTIDTPLWCFQKTWVPVPIFREVASPDIREVDVWFYHVSLKYHVKKAPRELSSLFLDIPHSAYEHPREWSAYLLSDPDKYGANPVFHSLVEALGSLSLPMDSPHPQ